MTEQEILYKLESKKVGYIDKITELEDILIFCKYAPFVKYFNDTKQVLRKRIRSSNFNSVLFVKYIYNGLSKILKSVNFEVFYVCRYSKSFVYDDDIVYNLSLNVLQLMFNDFKI